MGDALKFGDVRRGLIGMFESGGERIRVTFYRDLRVWQDAMTLAESCFQVTRGFPREETYGMTAQIRRSAASVAANIAEGYGREQIRPFIQFLRVSQGSLKELETHLILAQRIQLASNTSLEPLLASCETVGKMLRGLIRSLQKREIEV